jgi:hypothetical protein
MAQMAGMVRIVMSQTPSLQTIRAKKEALLASATQYDALAAKARAEAADYEAAERVWLKLTQEPSDGVALSGSEIAQPTRLHGISDVSVMGGPYEKVAPKTAADGSGTIHAKPPDAPRVPEMITYLLRQAEKDGKQGLTPSELLTHVQLTWWPEAKNSDVGSTAWRMWRDGRLAKPNPDSPIYALPKAKSSPPAPLNAGQEVISG